MTFGGFPLLHDFFSKSICVERSSKKRTKMRGAQFIFQVRCVALQSLHVAPVNSKCPWFGCHFKAMQMSQRQRGNDLLTLKCYTWHLQMSGVRSKESLTKVGNLCCLLKRIENWGEGELKKRDVRVISLQDVCVFHCD